MKRSPLPLLMGAMLGTQALLNGVSPLLPPKAHTVVDHINFISVAHAAEAAAVKYTCPMHPQIISDTPGKCPICGMDLVAVGGAEHTHQSATPAKAVAGEQSNKKVLYWYDPMVPGKQFDKPGKSPFMDMELVPKYADEPDAGDGSGKPVVSISGENLQKMGVRTEKVTMGEFGGSIRATGIITPNARARRDLFSQVEGRVDDLKFSAEGEQVKKGALFYTLYSPELLALQNDYIAAKKSGINDLAAAAAKRMKLLGVDDKVIAALAKSGTAYDKVPFYIPTDGILTKLDIHNGSYLMANSTVGSVQDLSNVWVEAAVPEGDLPAINQGDNATVTVTGNPTPYTAKVDYIYPTISPDARTGKVRLVVENKDGKLRLDGYATVAFATATASARVTVPSEAILRSSTGEHVIIALGDGKFQARDVKTGTVSGGKTEITEGLKEGEDVVTSAQFLIDSESSLRESLNKLSGGK